MCHKIPLTNQDKEKEKMKVKSDYRVLEELEAHLDGADTVFCMPERMEECEGVLKTICERSSLANPVKKFLNLTELFFKLVNSSQNGIVVPSRGILEGELNSER